MWLIVAQISDDSESKHGKSSLQALHFFSSSPHYPSYHLISIMYHHSIIISSHLVSTAFRKLKTGKTPPPPRDPRSLISSSLQTGWDLDGLRLAWKSSSLMLCAFSRPNLLLSLCQKKRPAHLSSSSCSFPSLASFHSTSPCRAGMQQAPAP